MKYIAYWSLLHFVEVHQQSHGYVSFRRKTRPYQTTLRVVSCYPSIATTNACSQTQMGGIRDDESPLHRIRYAGREQTLRK